MINVWFSIVIVLTIIITNYIALAYGLRLGKAMQKDIPDGPVEIAVETIKGAYRLVKDKTKKSYIQKKSAPEDENEKSPYN